MASEEGGGGSSGGGGSGWVEKQTENIFPRETNVRTKENKKSENSFSWSGHHSVDAISIQSIDYDCDQVSDGWMDVGVGVARKSEEEDDDDDGKKQPDSRTRPNTNLPAFR